MWRRGHARGASRQRWGGSPTAERTILDREDTVATGKSSMVLSAFPKIPNNDALTFVALQIVDILQWRQTSVGESGSTGFA
jgi:hypothetical protein